MDSRVTQAHKDLLCHILGDRTFYRNHFCASKTHSDIKVLREMEKIKLIYFNDTKNCLLNKGSFLFHATTKGKKIAALKFNFKENNND